MGLPGQGQGRQLDAAKGFFPRNGKLPVHRKDDFGDSDDSDKFPLWKAFVWSCLIPYWLSLIVTRMMMTTTQHHDNNMMLMTMIIVRTGCDDEDGDGDDGDGEGNDDDDDNDSFDDDNLQVRLQLSPPFHDKSRLLAPDQLFGRQE